MTLIRALFQPYKYRVNERKKDIDRGLLIIKTFWNTVKLKVKLNEK